jgi:uroporphyrinogen-III decarboxylase
MKKEIRSLMNEYLDIVNSEKNQNNKKFWEKIYGWNRDMWRGIPKQGSSIPFTIAPDMSLWSKILNVDLRDYYSNPEIFLETQLKMRIYHFNNFRDNTYFSNELFIWFGVITELTFFGAKVNFYPNREAWLEGNTIKEYDNLDQIEMPNFYKSGLMPRIHKYYGVLQEYADDADGKFRIMFPELVRGPFCIAAHLRGLENFLMDILLNPEFVHKLMRFVVDSHKQWSKERNKLLGNEIKALKLFNDEVDSSMISLDMYKEFIFPYERELAEYYGEVTYWHSCGVTDIFMEQINQLKNLRMFHCGPWTSYRKAREVFDAEVAFDICLDPQRDILEANKEQMVKKLVDIKDTLNGRRYFVRADALMPEKQVDFMLKDIEEWNEIALEILSNV